VPEDSELDPETEQLLFRAAGEAIRNVQRHAAPTPVEVEVSRADGLVRLEVSDDGAGFEAADRERRRAEGHMGLTLLEELVARRGGRLDVRSSPGAGTSFELEVPMP
jgi:signal transduction histidine kinase